MSVQRDSVKGRIIQILPANGWRAVYAMEMDDGTWVAEAYPLALWALIEEGDGFTSVVGMDCADVALSVEDNINHLGYIGPGDDIEPWHEAARRHGAMHERKWGKRQGKTQ